MLMHYNSMICYITKLTKHMIDKYIELCVKP